ncbi:MAG: type II secretion system F family protein [Holosporaceae bacterium]|jgi:tight adherence protein C|nr:type II secretion system F family protein [Holosporaceae bacterium]
MGGIGIDIITFLVTFVTLFAVKDSATRIAIQIMSDYKLSKRRKDVHSTTTQSIEEETGDLGLSHNGPSIGTSGILHFIATKNKDLIAEMQELLMKTGIRHRNALEEFMKSKLISAIAIFFIALITLATNDFDIPLPLCMLISLIGAILGGHKLTNLNLQIMANRRKEAIEHGVPDLIDLLVICTESGLDLNRAIRRIARELRTSNPLLADELSLTSIELEMIPDHRQVFENLENRTDCLEIKTISKTLSQSIEYGSSLSTSLRDLAVESRQRRMLEAEARAAQAPTLLTLPMMFFIMPCLFIVMLGPVIVGMIKSFNS